MQRFSQVLFRPLLRDKPNLPLLCPSVPGQGQDCTRMHQSRHSRPSPIYEQTRPMLYLHPQTGTRPTPASAEQRRPAGCAGHRHWILLRIRLSCPTPIPPAKRAAPSAGHSGHSTVRNLSAPSGRLSVRDNKCHGNRCHGSKYPGKRCMSRDGRHRCSASHGRCSAKSSRCKGLTSHSQCRDQSVVCPGCVAQRRGASRRCCHCFWCSWSSERCLLMHA